MLKQFYKKALPRQGVYCISGINSDTGKITNYFSETIDGVIEHINTLNNKGLNTFVALGAFNGYSRKKTDCHSFRSFFIDLDVGEEKAKHNKGYADKASALEALDKFVLDNDLPPPIKIDSGTGIHAYWLLEDEIPFEEYLPYAVKFKHFCLDRIFADPAVMADGARIMRCPDTFNYKTNPPSPTKFIDTEFNQYSFEAFKNFLDGAETPERSKDLPERSKDSTEDLTSSISNILASLPKGLDDETKAILKLDNFTYTFAELADKSINGSGCAQIRDILMNVETASRDLWAAGLTIAIKCADGETAIHDMSNEYSKYNYEETIKTANSFEKPRTCDWFHANSPELCSGCKHRGRINSPFALARELQIAGDKVYKEEPIREDENTEVIPAPTTLAFPKFLMPFVRGENGGIYFIPPTKIDKDGVKHTEDPILLIPHDLYPIRRMFSTTDGECLVMRLILPNDAVREFTLPMKDVYATDKFKVIMSGNGVFYNPTAVNQLTQYVIKWGQYMVNNQRAEIMRMQMGWTEEITDGTDIWVKKNFVIGTNEVCNDGTERPAAASSMIKTTSKHLISVGTYEKWQTAANELNNKGLELHAFVMLCGFGSPLMCYTSTSGVAVSLLGRSGCGKTGAMYAALSAFGNPKELSIVESTDNGMTGRYLALHNIPLGIDEIGDKDPKMLAALIHKISHGKAKIRMQGSVNAEREHEQSASLIGMFTTNQSIYNKLESIKASPDGEAARLIEFFVKKPELLGGDKGGEFGQRVFDQFRYNYGHSGSRFIKEVFKVGDAFILDTMKYWQLRFRKDFRTGDSAYRFYENLVQANMTAGVIAVNSGIINLDLERVYATVVAEMTHIKDKVITVNKIDYQSILGDFINKNMNNMLVLKESKVAMEPRGQLVARVDTDKSLLQVSRTVFKAYLAERSISSREFETTMRDLGVMEPADSRVRLTTGWKTSVVLEPVWCYVFITEFPKEWLEDAA